MAPRSDNGAHGLRHAGDDAFQLTVDYLKQETLEPLRGLGRFLYMGIAGSFFLAGGILLILIGILRLLQTETGAALTGNWSWVPYAVVVVLGIGIIACRRVAHHRRAGPGEAPGGHGPARRVRQRRADCGAARGTGGEHTDAGDDERDHQSADKRSAHHT